MIREAGHDGHIDNPQPTVRIYGLEPEKLRDREKFIVDAAKKQYEVYTRRGKTHSRLQKNTTPILLIGVASWPEPTMAPSPARDRWVNRVIRLCKHRFRKDLISVVAHVDEAFFHLHIWVDRGGKSVKDLHAGHGSVLDLLDEKPAATRREMAAAYKSGCALMQSWYARWAGTPFGHEKSPSPRKRQARSVALRERQEQIEAAELEQSRKRSEIVAQAEQIQLALDKLRAREARAAAAEAEVLQHTEMLKKALAKLQVREKAARDLRMAVQDQIAVERAIAQNGYQAPSVF